MKSSITVPGLANKCFNSLRDENDEPICTYKDEFMRHFVRQGIKRGRCSALNQYYKSSIADKKYNKISKELNVNGKICETLDIYFDYTIKHRKILEDEYDSQFDEYRKINQKERTK